ncbi:helix-turn-helix transcriptional regulator [Bacillus sp. FSL W7-1321]
MHTTFSKRLKELRTSKKIRQKDIAKALEISDRAYRFYETGDRFPDFQGIIILADLFDVSIDYLVGRSEDPKRY